MSTRNITGFLILLAVIFLLLVSLSCSSTMSALSSTATPSSSTQATSDTSIAEGNYFCFTGWLGLGLVGAVISWRKKKPILANMDRESALNVYKFLVVGILFGPLLLIMALMTADEKR